MKCPKCGKEMERMEFNAGLMNLGGSNFDLYFVCHNCEIFIRKRYKFHRI